jgi:hypothetical protein
MHSVIYDGLEYPSTEHAYQSAKFDDPTLKEKIRTAKTCGKAKFYGKILGQCRPDWELIKEIVMEVLLREKFKDPVLKKKLLDTRDAYLEEGNDWDDNTWGCCPTGNPKGKNLLGKLLMKIREELK